jgi:hypothetical protein
MKAKIVLMYPHHKIVTEYAENYQEEKQTPLVENQTYTNGFEPYHNE